MDRKTLAREDEARSNTCCFSFICMCASEGLGGTLSVVCGSQLGRNTASAINKNNLDVTMSTADTCQKNLNVITELVCSFQYMKFKNLIT